nr:hypothetical protein [Tanacetum cinerariifolium]
MQIQTSNTLHNAIMEAGSKDRPPMLAPGNYVQWKSRIKRYIDTKPNHKLIHYCLTNPPYELGWIDKEIPISKGSPIIRTERSQETYKNISQDIRDQLNAEAEAVQIIHTGIDNDIYSTVDACPNACEMWKAIKRLKQGESINVQDLETNLYWEFGKFTSQDGESLESYYSRSQQAATRNRGKAIVNSSTLIYDQEPYMVTEDDETSKDKDNSPRINRSVGYENQRIGNVAGARETVEVSPDAADSGPIFDDEPLQKVSNDDHYNVFAIESAHPEQSKSVHDTYPIEQDAHNVIIDSLDMSYDRVEIDHNDDDDDLANEPPESDEVIRLEKESRSKLSDLIRPFEYNKLNNLYDLFVPQREKSSEQRYFSERSRLSHTSVNNGNSKVSFNKQTTLLEKQMDESIPFD